MQTMTASLLPNQRHLFNIPADVVYLNCAYMSPLPKSSMVAGEVGLRKKGSPWTIEPADFFTDSEAVRALFAQLINASPDDIALIPAVSYGMAQAAHNIRLGRGKKIVTLAEEFPSNFYPWLDLGRHTGADLVSIPRPSDNDWTAALLDQMDSSVSLVAVPHCHWTDGGFIDLAAIAAECRHIGAVLCVDGSQSIGALPLDIKNIDPDFVAVGTYKWLLGPYSCGFLYVAPRWQSAHPIEQNWIARRDSQNFAGLVDYRDEFQPGARRFDVGERSNFALLPVVKNSLEILLDWGIANVYHTLKTRNDLIAERAEELGLHSIPSGLRAGHYLSFCFGEDLPPELPDRLAAAKVFISVRGRFLRVTPHLWNTDDDVAKFFAILKAVLQK